MATKSGKVDEFFDLEKFAKDKKVILDGMAEVAAAISKSGGAVKSSKSISEQKTEQDALNKVTEKAVRLSQDYAIADSKEAKAVAELQTQIKQKKQAVQDEINLNEKIVGAYKALETQVKKLGQEYKDLAAAGKGHTKQAQDLKALYDQQRKSLTELNQTMGNHRDDVGRYGKVWDGLKSSFFAVTGAIAAAAGAIKFAKDMMESTGSGADYLNKKIGGIKEGYHQFMVAIQTGDFSNLVTKMREAIAEGERYIETLDKIRDATTAVSIKQINLRVELEKQKTIERDNSKGKVAQIEAGKRGIEIENQLLKENMDLAQMAFNNEKKHVQEKTGLGFATISAALKGEDPNDPNFQKYQMAKKYLEIQEKIDKFAGTGNAAADKAIYADWKKEMAALGKEAEVTSSVIKKMNILTKEGADAEVPKLTAAWVNLGNVQTTNISDRRRLEIKLGNLEKGLLDNGMKEEDQAAKDNEKLQKETAKTVLDAKKDAFAKEKQAINDLILDYQRLTRAMSGGTGKLGRTTATAQLPTGTGAPATMSKVPNTEAPPVTAEHTKASDLSGEAAIWEKRFQLAQEWVSKIDNIVNQSYANRFAQIDLEAQADQEAKDRELKAAAGNTDKIKAINARYDAKEKEREKEKRRVQREQAKYQKTSGIISAIINTAVGVTSMIANPGGILGMVLAVLAGLMGVAEIALIASQPLPSYAKGRKGGKSEMANVGEVGRELIVTKSGDMMLTPPTTTTTFLPEGSAVIPHDQLLDLAGRSASFMPTYSNSTWQSERLENEIRGLHAGFRMLKTTIENKTEHNWYFENGELHHMVKNGNVQEEWINKNVMP